MRAILIALAIVCASPALGSFDYRPALRATERHLERANQIDLAGEADKTLESILVKASAVLRENGFDDDADEIMNSWQEDFKGYLPALVIRAQIRGNWDKVPEEYAPLSMWLSDVYHKLEDDLGLRMCELLHLTDIQVINWGTPVVLRLTGTIGQVIPTAADYELYFDPWCGVVTYWTVWGVCTGVTWGTGFLYCTPIAMVAETAMVNVIAPRLSPKVYARLYPPM